MPARPASCSDISLPPDNQASLHETPSWPTVLHRRHFARRPQSPACAGRHQPADRNHTQRDRPELPGHGLGNRAAHHGHGYPGAGGRYRLPAGHAARHRHRRAAGIHCLPTAPDGGQPCLAAGQRPAGRHRHWHRANAGPRFHQAALPDPHRHADGALCEHDHGRRRHVRRRHPCPVAQHGLAASAGNVGAARAAGIGALAVRHPQFP
ncbi:hypothetical protein J2T34_002239 [Kerstersia gyiorum]|nr:hypothetical protein [Kerstersia gyiorum]MCP1671753.1 hypothetical protein [Kerstersia gyiorum]MCP1709602.1 hypothetical protein [Kerstersia gyiorum]